MSRARLLGGWIVVVLIAGLVSMSTLLVVREAVGGGTVVDALSQADVATQYVIAQSHASAGSTPSGPSAPPAPSSAHPARSGTAPRASGPAARSAPSASTPGSVGARPLSGSASGAGTSSSAPPSVTRVLTSPGGSVVARCTESGGSESSGSVYLVSWSPAQGYSVDHARRGPGEEAEIEFESSSRSVSVTFRCSASGPVQSVENDDGWGDGGGDD